MCITLYGSDYTQDKVQHLNMAAVLPIYSLWPYWLVLHFLQCAELCPVRGFCPHGASLPRAPLPQSSLACLRLTLQSHLGSH